MAMVDELKVKLAERRKIVEPGRPSNLQQLKLFTSPECRTQGLAWEPGRVGPKAPELDVDDDLESDIQRLRLGNNASRGCSGLGRSSSCTAIGNALKAGVSGKAKRKLLQQQLADAIAERDGALVHNRRLHDELRDEQMKNEVLQGELQALRAVSPPGAAATTASESADSAATPQGSVQQATSVLHKEEPESLVRDLRSSLDGLRLLLAEEDRRSRQVASVADTGCSCGQRLAAIERAAEVLARFDPAAAELAARAPHAAEDSWLGGSLATRGPRTSVLESQVLLEEEGYPSTIERPARAACAPSEPEVLAVRAERQYWLEALQD